ncbi:MAG: PhoPQ-activated pathogenicity-related family protein [Sedimentisphaerales bacterium]|nr:PhoPQ-activated pathogenicity-related family protein [Sedimentisphaerales bacterium]
MGGVFPAGGTPLDDYVNRPDPHYGFRLEKTIQKDGYTADVIDLTSQAWRSENEVNRLIWRHWLTIIRPDAAASDTALLWITGGVNGQPAPQAADTMLVRLARHTQTVVVDLRTVPNQPLRFADDGRDRYEDAIVAYSFDRYVRTADATWPLLLPMAKSAVRAMDTVQAHIKQVSDGRIHIENFVVSGMSKRGWTSWLTAAVDQRVTAIIPGVIDVLNMDEQMDHHFAAYGFYSPAIRDYQDKEIFERMGTAEGVRLTDIVDPFAYRDRLGLPKYLVNSAGDQFFLPDSAQFYFADLPGEKYLRYVPNTDHSLGGSDAWDSVLAFYQSVLSGTPRPRFAWVIRDNQIMIHTQEKPSQVCLWQATNREARDFRLETIGPAWKKTELAVQAAGMYSGQVEKPSKGWTAFFVELTYPMPGGISWKCTTPIRVVPDVLPFADKLAERKK